MGLNNRLRRLEDQILSSDNHKLRWAMLVRMNEIKSSPSKVVSEEEEKEWNDLFFKFASMGISESEKKYPK